jgi:EAL domain-containing protein (putative c-di-GMP-specific phosphodiesterase class I)
MDLEVVAEGIETVDQLAYLKGAGCQRGQGFYFAKPMPEADAEAYLERACRGSNSVCERIA